MLFRSDVHLEPDEARAELLAHEAAHAPLPAPTSRIPSKLRHGWRWRSRLLAAVLAAVGPVWFIVGAVRWYAEEAAIYDALPPAERVSRGNSPGPDFDMLIAEFFIAYGVTALVLGLLVALPRRLWLWWGVLAALLAFPAYAIVAVDVGGLVMVAAGVVGEQVAKAIYVLLFILFQIGVPLLAVVRLIWQRRADRDLRLVEQPSEAQAA